MKDIDKKILELYSSGKSFNDISFETKKTKSYIRTVLIINNVTITNLKKPIEAYLPICKYCGTTENIVKSPSGRILKTCSNCLDRYNNDVISKRKKTNIKKYGVDNVAKFEHIKEKIKKTNIKKYGVENPTQNEGIRKKIETTNLKKYGAAHPIQNEHIKKKTEETNIKKYGTKNPSSNPLVRKRIKSSNIKKYGVDNIFKSEDFKEYMKEYNDKKYGVPYSTQADEIKEKMQKSMLKNWGVKYFSQNTEIKEKIIKTRRENYWGTLVDVLYQKKIVPLFGKKYYVEHEKTELKHYKCLRCNSVIKTDKINPHSIFCECLKHRSSYEDEIIDWLKSIKDFNIIKNSPFYENEKLKFEIDIYLPDFKIGIDFHGVYWHSEIYKDKNYHQKKFKFFKEQGIFLIQVFENEWVVKSKIIKSIILSKLGHTNKIFARKCTVSLISQKELKIFLEENHIQGFIGAKIKIGLKYKNELVMVATFGKNRFKKDNEYELLRLCSKCGITVTGGFAKLLNYLKINYNISSLVSFVDVRLFSGNGYRNVGFEQVELTKPNYFYFKKFDSNYTLHNRIKFQKHKLYKKLDIFDETLSEHKNMLNNGYLRIFDAGNIKMRLEF